MARKLELTWQAGIGGRAGRWRKKYLGKSHYFDGGRGKTDREAYARAIENWQNKKRELLEEDSKPNESDYLDRLREWRAARDWSAANDDQATLAQSRTKIKDLESRLASRRPPPISADDHFESRFSCPIIPIPLEIMDKLIGQKEDLESDSWKRYRARLAANDQGRIVPPPGAIEFSDGSPWRIAKEIWRDRIASQLRQTDATHAPATIEGNVARFLSQKRAQVGGGELSVGRYANLKLHLSLFQDFVGGSNPVSAITSRALTDFRTDLLERVSRGEFTAKYAKDRLDAAKQFTGWLFQEEALAQLPRVMASKTFTITPAPPAIKTLTVAETKTLLDSATGQLKLFIMLALNTGFLQKDISELKPEEVDWRAGVIRRKRSKTKKFENVPEVSYPLWPATFRLLQEYRRPNSLHVLANENGGSLLTSTLKEDGKQHKVDNIHTAYFRLCKRVSIKDRPFKSLRKTSATLLRSSEKYSGLEDLFLGHAPRSMSDKHYAGIPHELMASALDWLGRELGLIAADKKPAAQDRQPAKHKSRPARGRSKKGAKAVAANAGQ